MPGAERRLIVSVCFSMYKEAQKKRRRRRNSMPARQTYSSSCYSTIERISILVSFFVQDKYMRFLTKLDVDGRMPYRPLLLSLLHSSFTARHLSMNYLPMYIKVMVVDILSFFLFFSLSLTLLVFVRLPVHRSDGYLKG
jgi:hypothetical protein